MMQKTKDKLNKIVEYYFDKQYKKTPIFDVFIEDVSKNLDIGLKKRSLMHYHHKLIKLGCSFTNHRNYNLKERLKNLAWILSDYDIKSLTSRLIKNDKNVKELYNNLSVKTFERDLKIIRDGRT